MFRKKDKKELETPLKILKCEEAGMKVKHKRRH